MRTIKITSFEQLISNANTVISNNQADISQLRFDDMLPNNVGANYRQNLGRFEALSDSAANLSNPRDLRIAQSLSAVGRDYFSSLANISGTLLAEQTALNMAQGQVFGDVRFQVSDDVRQRLINDRQQLVSEYMTVNREAYMCLAAMNSVVNGVPFNMDEYYEMLAAGNNPDIDDELTEVIDLDEDEHGMVEELESLESIFESEELENGAVAQIVGRMSELTGEGFEEITTAEDFNNFTGERGYTAAALRISMGDADGLDMDNYRQKLSFGASAENRRWCVDSVNTMFRSFYGDEKYETMVRDGVDMFAGIYIDGKPSSTQYGGSHPEKCTALMRDILDGGHRLNISPLEKGADGKYSLTDTVCDVSVQPSLVAQEEFSLWKAILRFFGFHIKTRAEKMEDRVSFAELENQDAVEKIRAFSEHDNDYNRRVRPIREAREEHERLMDNVEAYAFAPNLSDPNTYFAGASHRFEFVPVSEKCPDGLDKAPVIKTLGRMPSRGSLVTMYMLAEGMTMEQLINPNEADKERMKQYGKEFTEIMTMPESPFETAKREHPEYSREQLIKELEKPELRERYQAACDTQIERITAAYEKMHGALRNLESQLPPVDMNNPMSIAAACNSYSLFSTASCDILQSLETPIMTGENVEKRTTPIMNYANDNQYKHSVRDTAKAMVAPDFKASIIGDPTSLYAIIAGGLVNKNYEMSIANGMQPSSATFNMLNFKKAQLNDEISNVVQADPAAISYAMDVLSGRLPMPENMITENGAAFAQCYQEHKQRSAPALQMDRTNQR